MSSKNIPEWFELLNDEYEDYMNTLEELGRVVRQTGPIDEKTSHLIQLAAAAAINSEGAVHSHARRAQQAGATIDKTSAQAVGEQLNNQEKMADIIVKKVA